MESCGLQPAAADSFGAGLSCQDDLESLSQGRSSPGPWAVPRPPLALVRLQQAACMECWQAGAAASSSQNERRVLQLISLRRLS